MLEGGNEENGLFQGGLGGLSGQPAPARKIRWKRRDEEGKAVFRGGHVPGEKEGSVNKKNQNPKSLSNRSSGTLKGERALIYPASGEHRGSSGGE